MNESYDKDYSLYIAGYAFIGIIVIVIAFVVDGALLACGVIG
jgi:hypothetical protein